jgi:hypothetical protein
VRFGGFATIAVAAILGCASVARATCADSSSANLGPTGSASGYAQWNGGTRHLKLNAHADADLVSGICADAWFDWVRTERGYSSHFDARVARTCRPDTIRWADGSDGYTESQGGDSEVFHGPHRLGACRSDGSDGHNAILGCAQEACAGEDIKGHVHTDLPNMCARGWTMSANGTTHYYSGGDPRDCSN